MYKYKLSKSMERVLVRLVRKDKKLYESLIKKMEEIVNCNDIEHYKNLKYAMKEYKRVHVGSFVLFFRFDKKNRLILFTDFEHYDKVY